MGWSAVLAQAYNSTKEQIFALNGTYKKRIEGGNVFDWGIAAPSERPTLSAVTASVSGITGDYNAKYTYARKERNTIVCESNGSSAARATASPSGEDLRVTFTEPEDEQVNCIRIYRTIDGGSDYYHDSDYNWGTGDYAVTHQWEIDDEYLTGPSYLWTTSDITHNTDNCFIWEEFYDEAEIEDEQRRVTGYAENHINYIDTDTADTSLGTALHTDHDQIPDCAYVSGPTFDGILFAAYKGDLYFCKSKQPEYWPSSYYVRVTNPALPGKCIVFWNENPYYLTISGIYQAVRVSDTSFVPRRVPAKTGTQSQNGAVAIEGWGIFHVGLDGIYLCNPTTDNRVGIDKRLSSPFDPIFRGETTNGVPGVGDLSTSWLTTHDGKLYFGYAGSGDTYPQNILVADLENNRIGYFDYGVELHHASQDVTNGYLLAGDENGYVWRLEDNSVDTDGGEDIEWEVESKEFTLSTRAHFPRWVKYDIRASDADSVTGSLLLDGTVQQAHTVTGDRITKRRLVASGNGERCSLRVSGSGPVKIYAIESE